MDIITLGAILRLSCTAINSDNMMAMRTPNVRLQMGPKTRSLILL